MWEVFESFCLNYLVWIFCFFGVNILGGMMIITIIVWWPITNVKIWIPDESILTLPDMCCPGMITLVVLFTSRMDIETVSFILAKISIFLFGFSGLGGCLFCCAWSCSWRLYRTGSCRNGRHWCISGWWFTLDVGGPVTILELWIEQQSIGTTFDVSSLMRTLIKLLAIRMSINSINLIRTEFSWFCYWWRLCRCCCWL